MIPFHYIVFTLLVGLGEVTGKQVPNMAGLISPARLLTAVSWCTYPVVYAVESMGLPGTTATEYEQIDYSVRSAWTLVQADLEQFLIRRCRCYCINFIIVIVIVVGTRRS